MNLRRRLLLADDHVIVLEGLRRVLEREYEIVGGVCDGRALVEAAASLRPDIIVADVSMPLLNGIEAARQIRRLHRRVKIVFLTMHPDVTYAAEALAAGGSAYVLKSSGGAELLEAIQRVLAGEVYLSPGIDRQAVHDQMPRTGRQDQLRKALTSRQREVLQLLAEGKTLKEVAAVLRVSAKTVEFHKYRIMSQIGAKTNAEMTKYAVKFGLSTL